jgi:hypothetical protein
MKRRVDWFQLFVFTQAIFQDDRIRTVCGFISTFGSSFIMQLQRCLSIGLISACLSISAWLVVPDRAGAQEGAPTISSVTLQVVPGQQGESVITPKGMVVPLPGAGVNSGSVQIYMGSQGGYWYVDRNGQNVDLTSYVERFRSMNGGGGQSAQVPQYAPAPQQPVNIYNQQAPSSSSSSGGGSSGMGTAAAAGLGAMGGAMLGTAMTGSYYNNNGYYHGVPYGTPMYYPHGGTPTYVNASGNSVNVDKNYQGAQGNTAANVQPTTVNNQHAENMQKQQEWYQNQAKQNPNQFKSWQQSASGENPFVNQQSQGRFGRGAQTAEGGEGGMFGRRGQEGGAGAAQGLQQEGGRFNRGAEGAGGGRFGGGRLGGGEGGGRLGGLRRGGR